MKKINPILLNLVADNLNNISSAFLFSSLVIPAATATSIEIKLLTLTGNLIPAIVTILIAYRIKKLVTVKKHDSSPHNSS